MVPTEEARITIHILDPGIWSADVTPDMGTLAISALLNEELRPAGPDSLYFLMYSKLRLKVKTAPKFRVEPAHLAWRFPQGNTPAASLILHWPGVGQLA
jgi:hypothetical protein